MFICWQDQDTTTNSINPYSIQNDFHQLLNVQVQTAVQKHLKLLTNKSEQEMLANARTVEKTQSEKSKSLILKLMCRQSHISKAEVCDEVLRGETWPKEEPLWILVIWITLAKTAKCCTDLVGGLKCSCVRHFNCMMKCLQQFCLFFFPLQFEICTWGREEAATHLSAQQLPKMQWSMSKRNTNKVFS